jgi:hypothetical protein
MEDCPSTVPDVVRNAYFAPLARVRAPRVAKIVGEVLEAALAKVPRLQGRLPRAETVDVFRRLVESSLRRRLPGLEPADMERGAESLRLRAENARLSRRVKMLEAALGKERARRPNRGGP